MDNPALSLSIRDLKAYTYCPLYYRFKQSPLTKKLPEEKELLEEVLRRTGQFILYSAQSGKYPSRRAVSMAYNRFAKAVYKSMKHVRQDARELKSGLRNVLELCNFLSGAGTPVLISYRGLLDCESEQVEVLVDAIVEKYGKYKAVTLVPWEKKEYEILPVDPEVSAVWLVARKILSRPLNSVIVYHLFQGTGEEIATSGLEEESTKKIFAAIVRGIKNEIYYPSAGRSCRKCTFFPFCTAGKIDL